MRRQSERSEYMGFMAGAAREEIARRQSRAGRVHNSSPPRAADARLFDGMLIYQEDMALTSSTQHESVLAADRPPPP
jgi:hypothetical protein